ncbi:MAG: hypothetical protein CVU73_15860 [Deltaproteobacteria bacterium HGW-Deltaproteobacteria-8]|jgi:hypothetical protein|nr:MAG: hypothetical protein CVU73_15860 [Deltaproteobacteria bacterium HGW-Deltaproteobacteria-8]
MIREKINSAVTRLHELGGQVSPEHWELIRAATAELKDASDSARHLETAVLVITIPVANINRQ